MPAQAKITQASFQMLIGLSIAVLSAQNDLKISISVASNIAINVVNETNEGH